MEEGKTEEQKTEDNKDKKTEEGKDTDTSSKTGDKKKDGEEKGKDKKVGLILKMLCEVLEKYWAALL